jgi:CheY-like chemotaxis protein
MLWKGVHVSRETPLKLCGRILVVDDSADGRTIVSRVLRCIGLETEDAPDGKVAFEKAMSQFKAGRPFDLILMDMHMPVMDGFTATAMLRLRGYTAPIAALSALVGANTRQECLDAGCNDYAAKPIDFQSLRDLVQRHLTPATATPRVASRQRSALTSDVAQLADGMVPGHTKAARAEIAATSKIGKDEFRPSITYFETMPAKGRPDERARPSKVEAR